MDDVTGPTQGGGTFDIQINTDTEMVLFFNNGLQQRLGESWSTCYETSVERHQANWELRDKNSGSTSAIGDYTVIGVHAGLNYCY